MGLDFDGGLNCASSSRKRKDTTTAGADAWPTARSLQSSVESDRKDPQNHHQRLEFRLQGGLVNHFVMENHETVFSIKTKGEENLRAATSASTPAPVSGI
jgi:hypothetical protein